MEKQIDLTRALRIFRIVNQALCVSLLGTILVAVCCYVLTAAAPILGDVTWSDAAQFGAAWWLTGFGGQVKFAAGTLSLIPSLLTLLTLAGIYFPLKKAQLNTWNEVAVAAFSGVPLIALTGLFSGADGPWWTAIIGIIVLNTIISIYLARAALIFSRKLPEFVDSGLQITKFILAIYFGAALLTLIIFAGFGAGQAIEIQGMYHQGIFGNIGIVFVQLLYLPILFIWAGAWMVGAKIALGAGSYASILGSQIGLLPAIPLLGVIPGPVFGNVWMLLVPLFVFFTAGIVLVLILRRKYPVLRQFASAAAFAVLVSVFGIELVGVLAAGSLGPGRMSEFGAQPTDLAWHTLLLFALPLYAGMMFAHPVTLQKIREYFARGKEKVRGAKQTFEMQKEAKAAAADAAENSVVTETTASAAAETFAFADHEMPSENLADNIALSSNNDLHPQQILQEEGAQLKEDHAK
ncbi:cell division protein PerM [Arcanobacterium hippocoleae]|uniref:cell division protein PerM n=1 Tax=Arcanobacterium hippocoleae TaxID=149017 RepID=UPI0033426280